MITLTKKQSDAIKIMSTKFNNKDPITVIAGYAARANFANKLFHREQ